MDVTPTLGLLVPTEDELSALPVPQCLIDDMPEAEVTTDHQCGTKWADKLLESTDVSNLCVLHPHKPPPPQATSPISNVRAPPAARPLLSGLLLRLQCVAGN